MLSCDLVVAAESAKFGIPEVKRGLAAAAGGLFRLPLRIPYHVAMELVLTGDPVEAPRAYELGLVNKLTPTGGALDAALDFAGRSRRTARWPSSRARTSCSHARGWSDEEAQQAQESIVRPVLRSEDAQGRLPRVRREAAAGVARWRCRQRRSHRTGPLRPGRALVAELDADLTVRYGGDGDPVHAPAAEFDGPGGQMLLATRRRGAGRLRRAAPDR